MRPSLPVVACLAGLLGLLSSPVLAGSERDPWEGFNRQMHAFNDALDRYVLKPVAKGYRAVTPDFADRSVSRFFANLHDVADSANLALQGDFTASRDSVLRVLGNTTIGLGGLLDPAGAIGLANHDTNFGITLGKWGTGSGPYLVLPFLGPGTVRGVAALPVDMTLEPLPEPWSVVESDGWRISLGVLDKVDRRADLLDYEQAMVGDHYAFLRDIYLQRLDFAVHGAAAEDPFLDDDMPEEEVAPEVPADEGAPSAEPAAE
ncbi:MAG: MlaA family lipoprotein [Pseudomonadota bacterium]